MSKKNVSSDEPIRISFVALMRFLVSVVGETVPVEPAGDGNTWYLEIDDSDTEENNGNGFYDPVNGVLYDYTENWGEALRQIVQVKREEEAFVGEAVYSDMDEEEWQNRYLGRHEEGGWEEEYTKRRQEVQKEIERIRNIPGNVLTKEDWNKIERLDADLYQDKIVEKLEAEQLQKAGGLFNEESNIVAPGFDFLKREW